MQNITTAWRRDPIYNEINTALNAGKTFQLSGLPLLADAGLLAAMFKDDSKSVLVLTSSEESAQALYDNLRVFCGDDAMLFPVLELLPFEMYAHNIELSSARIKVLSSLAQGKKILVVACANAYVRRLAPMQDFLQYHMTLHCGDVIAPDELSARLVDMGYERTPLTEIPGTFSLRGSIVDIYPIVGVNPYRIEFFDDEIESIRSFDASGQRSVGDAREIVVCPANELPVNSAARARAYELLKAEYEKTLALLHGLAKKELQNSYAPLLEYLQEGVWSNNMDALASCFYPQAGSIIDYLQGGTVVVCEPDLFRDTCIRLEHDRALCYADLLEGGRLMPSFFDSFINYEEL